MDAILESTVMIQIRNAPESLHRTMKSRAAQAGMSLSDYLLRELRQIAEQPTMEEWRARLHTRSKTNTSLSAADMVRAERDRA